jgi:hypothetical protein
VKSLSEEVATSTADCEAKRKRIALLEMLLADHEAVVSSRYLAGSGAAAAGAVPTVPSAAHRPLHTLRGGASEREGDGAISTAFVAWLRAMGGAGH